MLVEMMTGMGPDFVKLPILCLGMDMLVQP